ncbi:MAG: hypothetical protein ABI591_02090 [Kofleriaceae bacterium]
MNNLSIVVVLVLAGCGKAGISETRMISGTPRGATCNLDLVQVDITQISFNSTWDVLGYVTLLDKGTQDPAAPENREIVRPRACNMGGTAVAVAINGMSQNNLGRSGSGLVYMVLRPKTAAAVTTTF